MFLSKSRLLVSLCAVALTTPVWAQTTVKDAWVRGVVAQQTATGAFMEITSAHGGKLVSVASPVAGVVQVHEMKMDGNVMKMGPVDALTLPAGQTVTLQPGGYHVMLMDLKQALKAGDQVPLTLTVVDQDGKKEVIEIHAPVRALGMPGAGPQHDMAPMAMPH